MRNRQRVLAVAGIVALLSGCVAGPAANTATSAPAGDASGSADETAAALQSTDIAASETVGASTATPLVPGVPVKLEATSRIAPGAASTGLPRAGSSVYRCGGGRSMTVDNRRGTVTLLDPDGEAMTLPASPSGQYNRYGQKPYALVLDGNEALYVKPRKAPFTCKR